MTTANELIQMSSHRPYRLHGAALALLTLLIAPLHAMADEAADKALDKARSAWMEGDPQAALIRLKDLLQHDPDNARARLLLARVYLDRGDAIGAEQEIERARGAGLGDTEALPVLAEVLLAQGRAADVLERIEIPTDAPASLHAELLALRGEAHLRTGDTDEAGAAFREALEIDPENVRAGVGKARLTAADGDIAAARSALQVLGEAHPEAVLVWQTLGMIEYAAQDYAAADAAYTRAIEHGRSAWGDHYRRALARIDSRDLEGARKDTEIVAAAAPGFAGLAYLRGRTHLLENDPAAAVNELDSYLLAAPDDPRAIYYAALALYQSERYVQAEEYLERLASRFDASVTTATLLGLTRLQRGDAAGAADAVARFANSDAATPATLEVLRRALVAQGRSDEAGRIVSQMVARFPDLASAHLLLAQQLAASGDAEGAVAQVRTALEQEPDNTQARVLLIRNLLLANDSDGALAEAEALVAAEPESPLAHTVLAAVHTRRQELDAARGEFRKALELDPGYTRAALALAALDLGSDDAGGARTTLDDLLAVDPANTSALLARAGLERRTAGDAAYIDRLRTDLAANPDNLTLRLTLARAYLGRDDAEAALKLLQDAPADQNDQPMLLLLRAQAELTAGRGQSAVVTLAALAEQNPRAAQPHYLLAVANARIGDLRAAEQQLTDGLALDRTNALGAAQLAAVLSALPSDDERTALLGRLGRMAPEQPAVAAARANLARRQREFSTALSLFEDLRRRHPDTAEFVLGQAQTLNEAGRPAEAGSTLQTWLDNHPRSLSARMLLAQIAMQNGESKTAIEQYRQVLELRPEQPIAMNNLAMLIAAQAPEEALELAERGLKQRPDEPAFLDTAGLALLELGQNERARDMLARAHQGTPDPSIAYRYAKALAATGDRDKARRVLLQNAGKSYPEQDEAEALLRSLQD
jgi:putative PEP-CTERM system TPR-repeat lipoprotein